MACAIGSSAEPDLFPDLMFRLRRFYSPNLCSLAISVGAYVCDDERCGAVHGRVLTLQCTWWGIELEYMRS